MIGWTSEWLKNWYKAYSDQTIYAKGDIEGPKIKNKERN
jgi:hypothetical protein